MRSRFELGLVVGCLFFAAFVAACAAEGGESVTITDQAGRNVTVVPDEIERIISFGPLPSTAMIIAIEGSGERIVGMSSSAMQAVEDGIMGKIYPELLDVQSNSSWTQGPAGVNIEEVLRLDPDIVFTKNDEDQLKIFNELGIPAVVIGHRSLDDWLIMMTNVGRVLGKDDRAARLVEYHKEMFEELKAITEDLPDEERPSVMFIPFAKGLRTVPSTVMPAVYIDIAGGTITTKELTRGSNQAVAMEQVIKWNPDVVLLGNFEYVNPQDLYNNSLEGQDWTSIKAFQNKRVYLEPLGVYRWGPPNHEAPLQIMWLGELLHPDLFNYDLRQEMKDFYKEMYDYDLSEEEIDDILHCDVNSVSAGYEEAFCRA